MQEAEQDKKRSAADGTSQPAEQPKTNDVEDERLHNTAQPSFITPQAHAIRTVRARPQ